MEAIVNNAIDPSKSLEFFRLPNRLSVFIPLSDLSLVPLHMVMATNDAIDNPDNINIIFCLSFIALSLSEKYIKVEP